MIIRVCPECGITPNELHEVSYLMRAKQNPINDTYDTEFNHEVKCNTNWVIVDE